MFLRKYKKGLGLVEVLIVLVIVSTTMIIAMRTVANGLKTVKENEIRDNAAGIMLRGISFNQIEIPDSVYQLPTNPNIPLVKSYKLAEHTTGNNIISDLQNIPLANSTTPEITTCDGDSDYLLNNLEGIELCHQIIITNTQIDDYTNKFLPDGKVRITSIVVYKLNEKTEVQKISNFAFLD